MLKAFLDRFPTGKLADDVRKRPLGIEPGRRRMQSRRAILIGGGVVGANALTGVAGIVS